MWRPSRYAPNAPSGIATTTVSVCASPVGAEEHRAHRADQRERRRRRRRRSEPGVAPRRPEAVEHVADAAASAPKVPIAGTPWVIRSREPSATSTRKPRNAIAAGRAHAVGHRVDRAARRVAEGAQPGVGVEVVGEERAESRGARHLQLAELGVVDRRAAPARAAATRAAVGRAARFENQLPMAARARRGRPVSRSPTASTNPTTNAERAPARAAGGTSTT